MIPSDLAARLRMLTEASLFDSEPPIHGPARVREIQARLPELAPGEKFTATLQRNLPDGTFQAIVAGRTYTLALNHSARPGDTLELVVTQNTPKAVYAQLAQPSAPAATATADAAVRPNLSAVGRLIGFLLTGQPASKPAVLAAGKPVIEAPPTANSATLAPALRQAIAQSGLFYESHQLQWISGKLDTAALRREPQGQQPVPRWLPAGAANLQPLAAENAGSPPGTPQTIAGRPAVPGQSAAAPTQTPQLPTGSPPQPNPAAQPGPALQPDTAQLPGPAILADMPTVPDTPPTDDRTAVLPPPQPEGAAPPEEETATHLASPLRQTSESGTPIPPRSHSATQASDQTQPNDETAGTGSAASPGAANRLATVPERLIPVVHQQLDAMATQTYVWQGQVWPGQTMEWEIEDAQRDGGGEDADTPAEWNTTLRLTLPRLGGVEARLILTPAGVALRLLADDAGTVRALDGARQQLDDALAAANVPLAGFVAERRDDGR